MTYDTPPDYAPLLVEISERLADIARTLERLTTVIEYADSTAIRFPRNASVQLEYDPASTAVVSEASEACTPTAEGER